MSTYERLSGLPVEIDSYELEGRSLDVSSAFTRHTTVIRLRGGGGEGVGEDVTYDAADQLAFQDAGPSRPLAGSHTVDSFSRLVETLGVENYRRWAFESAALDLALQQAGTSLAEALGREHHPVTFVVSTRLPDPPTLDRLRLLLDRYPGMKFKLDPTSAWTDDLVDDLRATGAVVAVDLKGHYVGTIVDQPPDVELYERVAIRLPDAWIEDPALTPETDRVLAPHRDRITWDAPIHSVADVEALPFAPRMVNVKPSRFGAVRTLFETYDYLSERGIRAYGGGQFELGPGRGQIQYLASLFHPDEPNDVAPGGFNEVEPRPDLPGSPLPPTPATTGFAWE